MITVYKIISVYLIFSFTIGTLFEIDSLFYMSAILSIFSVVLIIMNRTRQWLIMLYNKYILPNIWIVLSILGPIHFYLSVDNSILCIISMGLSFIGGMMELNYKIKSGDYTKWEI